MVDYTVGLLLKKESNKRKRKIYLSISLITNLGLLGFFKYFNFFLDNFIKAFTVFGFQLNISHLSIVLPVGISFYTFQTLSYTIDVFNKKLEPTNDIFSFLAFVSFFPQLVAGPIERASNLLPQFYQRRVFDYSKAVDGLKQMLWGFFKKLVIADNCAKIVDQVFSNLSIYSGSSIFIASIFFAFQIYGDFSGYSDIAIGTSKLFGFELMTNFLYPYFSRDIAEFWRRWHISLSTWFRDYLYIPLGGSKKSLLRNVINTFIVFLVSGFWHGASWNFVLWGLLNALYFLPLLLLKKNRKNIEIVAYNKKLPSIKEIINILRIAR
jgi:D-alanyl-lipoteichoic acid acyltransferase DltB (MBOAT superfamily)